MPKGYEVMGKDHRFENFQFSNRPLLDILTDLVDSAF